MTGAGKPRILVVDDDRFSQRLMQDMLVPLGYAVTIATDGLQAIDLARRIRPHLVVPARPRIAPRVPHRVVVLHRDSYGLRRPALRLPAHVLPPGGSADRPRSREPLVGA